MPESKDPKATDDGQNRPRAAEDIAGYDDPDEPRRRLTVPPGSRPWVAPAFITVGLLGVIWLVVYYIAGRDVPLMNKLGDWNILIGMGLMAASLGLSMLWK